jgi:hypothetical protein
VTTEEPPPVPTKQRFVAAARAMWTLAGIYAVHLAVSLLTTPPERWARRSPAMTAAIVGTSLVITGVHVWLGYRLRSGRSAVGAFVALGLSGLLRAAALGLTLLTKSGYQGAPALVVVEIASGLAWIAALTLTLRAWTAP